MVRHRGVKKSYSCNGDLLRQYRSEKSWTQSDLARITGFSERLISKAEAGKPVSVATIEALAKAFGCDQFHLRMQDLTYDPIELAKKYLHAFYTHQDKVVENIRCFLDDNATFTMCGKEEGLPYGGVHRGVAEISKAFEMFFSVFEVPENYDYLPHYKFFSNGNEVIIWGNTWIYPIGRPLAESMPITIRLRFEAGKIVEFDDRFDSSISKKILNGARKTV